MNTTNSFRVYIHVSDTNYKLNEIQVSKQVLCSGYGRILFYSSLKHRRQKLQLGPDMYQLSILKSVEKYMYIQQSNVSGFDINHFYTIA